MLQKLLLIVDDERMILKSLERLFRKTSFTVQTTDSAAKALAIVASEPVAVLMSDFSMPEMTGASLLSKAKLIRPDMTRVILSGNNDQAAVIQSLNEGAAHRYLTKPWEDDFLVQEIEAAFETYQATQFVDGSSELMTLQALSEQIQLSFCDTGPEQFVMAFMPDSQMLQREPQACLKLQKVIASGISSQPLLSCQDSALGLLNNNQFCLCVPSPAETLAAVEELINALPCTFQIGDLTLPLKFHVGYTKARVGKTLDEVFYECKTALNEAAGFGSTIPLRYRNSQSVNSQRKASLESKLFAALDRGELDVHFQPKIQTSDHSLCGAEALLRWNNPDLGFVSPVEFIPVAESNGLIHPIGLWVLEQSILRWQAWFGSNQTATRISINVSSVQLEDKNLLASVQKLIDRTSINPACLELEITETSMMTNTDNARDLLIDLKELGLHLSIDDFGTGYSSLSYLSQLPIDTIKIDRSFISTMLSHAQNESLVRNIIAIAKDLNKETVAEGVETEEQLNKLKSLGCDVIQGYFFSKPLPPHEFQLRYSDSLIQSSSEYSPHHLIKKRAV